MKAAEYVKDANATYGKQKKETVNPVLKVKKQRTVIIKTINTEITCQLGGSEEVYCGT